MLNWLSWCQTLSYSSATLPQSKYNYPAKMLAMSILKQLFRIPAVEFSPLTVILYLWEHPLSELLTACKDLFKNRKLSYQQNKGVVKLSCHIFVLIRERTIRPECTPFTITDINSMATKLNVGYLALRLMYMTIISIAELKGSICTIWDA